MALFSRRVGMRLLNVGLRALMAYLSVESISATVLRSDDRRYTGKGIAARNAIILASYSFLLPALYWSRRRAGEFPWVADSVLLSVPTVDMVGNAMDLYNRHDSFDVVAHFYGNFAVGTLAALALAERSEPPVVRWLAAAGGTTLFHTLLEVQEYWTDVLLGTHNVEGLEDVEGDLLAGIGGALAGVLAVELALGRNRSAGLRREARRLSDLLEPILGAGRRSAGAGRPACSTTVNAAVAALPGLPDKG